MRFADRRRTLHKGAMIIRYGIANVTPEHLATLGQRAGLSGSISAGFGFGEWGVEPTSFLEIALTGDVTASRTDAFVQDVLISANESAAYRVVDGHSASLLYGTGKRVKL